MDTKTQKIVDYIESNGNVLSLLSTNTVCNFKNSEIGFDNNTAIAILEYELQDILLSLEGNSIDLTKYQSIKDILLDEGITRRTTNILNDFKSRFEVVIKEVLSKKYKKKELGELFCNKMNTQIELSIPLAKEIILSSFQITKFDEDEEEFIEIKTAPSAHANFEVLRQKDQAIRGYQTIKCIEDIIIESCGDLLDMLCCEIIVWLFKFSRKLNEDDRMQVLGNIGALDDIARIMQKSLVSKIVGHDTIEWIIYELMKNEKHYLEKRNKGGK